LVGMSLGRASPAHAGPGVAMGRRVGIFVPRSLQIMGLHLDVEPRNLNIERSSSASEGALT
ncbi:MAG: hypothetical protein ACE5JQ_15425, partial [Candidatus Methylomirabilales bacterium]